LACVGVSEIKYLLKTGTFSANAIRKIAINRLKNIYKSFDDISLKTKTLRNKLDKADNKRYIEREFYGEGTAQEHFEVLAEQNGVEFSESLQNFQGKDGATYSIHTSTGGDGRRTITKKYVNKAGEKVEEKVRFAK